MSANRTKTCPNCFGSHLETKYGSYCSSQCKTANVIKKLQCPECSKTNTERYNNKLFICNDCHLKFDPREPIPTDAHKFLKWLKEENRDAQDTALGIASAWNHAYAAAMKKVYNKAKKLLK